MIKPPQEKILVIALGGTIGSVREDNIKLDKDSLKILKYNMFSNIAFETVSPFTIFSENMTVSHWQALLDYLSSVDFEEYKGVIILHGSDTLAFTSSIIANAFADKTIVLVASDKPVEDKDSNAFRNFNDAMSYIMCDNVGVVVSYDGIKKGNAITSANIRDEFVEIDSTIKPINSQKLSDKNILIIKSYVSIDYDNYNIDNIDEVLIEMYHSATAPIGVEDFVNKLKSKNISYHFVTHKSKAEYETAQNFDNIIFNSTVENAYAMCLLKKD